MAPTIASVAAGLLLLGLLFGLLERARPAIARRPFLRWGLLTDVAYSSFTPLVTKAITRTAVAVALVLLALASGVRMNGDAVRAFFASSSSASPLRLQPVWLQVLEVLLLGDLRLPFHSRQPEVDGTAAQLEQVRAFADLRSGERHGRAAEAKVVLARLRLERVASERAPVEGELDGARRRAGRGCTQPQRHAVGAAADQRQADHGRPGAGLAREAVLEAAQPAPASRQQEGIA